MKKININVKSEQERQEILTFLAAPQFIWSEFPISLNTKTELHTFLDFYQRIEDLMGKTCKVFYKSVPSSFRAKKEKIEKVLGNFIPENTQNILDCRRKLTHEIIKTNQNEELIIKSTLEKINFGVYRMSDRYKQISSHQTESILWFALFEFNRLLTACCTREIIKKIGGRLSREEALTLKMFLFSSNLISAVYRSRIVYMEEIKKLRTKVEKEISVKIEQS